MHHVVYKNKHLIAGPVEGEVFPGKGHKHETFETREEADKFIADNELVQQEPKEQE